jgi:spermidine/putrescine transport system permease protein
MAVSAGGSRTLRRAAPTLSPLLLYMLVFFVLPVAIFFVYSFWRVSGWDIVKEWGMFNYRELVLSPVYSRLMLRSLWVGFITAALSILVCYPLAYTLVFKLEKYRDLILFLLAISLFSNYLVRIYAWRSILSSNGLVNSIAMSLGLAAEPRYYLLYQPAGVILTLLNVYIPFATLPIFSSLMNVERDVIDAASDLGAHPLRAFARVTLPLSMPGVQAAYFFIFLLAAGDFVTPELVGGRDGMLIGNAIATQFGLVFNWPLGSAMAFSMIVLVLAAFVVTQLLLRASRLAR